MRPHATLRKPAILSRRLLSLIVRGVAITSMAFAVAFGFLAGAIPPRPTTIRTCSPSASRRCSAPRAGPSES